MRFGACVVLDSTMISVVFDSNVLVSAFLSRNNPGGVSNELRRFARQGAIQLHLSPPSNSSILCDSNAAAFPIRPILSKIFKPLQAQLRPRLPPPRRSPASNQCQRFAAGRVSTRKSWCPGAESNHRHTDFQSVALPTELPGRSLAYREAAPFCPARRLNRTGSRESPQRFAERLPTDYRLASSRAT